MPSKWKYRILFLSSFDPRNRKKLSGVSYTILNTLEQYFEVVDVIGPVKCRRLLKSVFGRLSRMLTHKYNLDHSFLLSRLYAWSFSREIGQKQYDFIFAPRASTEIACLKTSVPIVYYSDTTFQSLYNYYEWFSDFLKISVWEGNRIEKRALNNAFFCIFTSEWAAQSAVEFYKISPEKISIIPFGPNLDKIPLASDVLIAKQNDVCRLLFLGVEWERKGGAIAFETFRELNRMGIPTTLTVCGCIPPEQFLDKGVTVIPYINKNNPDENSRFEDMMKAHHFLILPTRAECFGLVFAEASAFAIPSITTDTGGIGSAVKNGINGYRLSLNANGPEYAEIIAGIFIPFEKYTNLCISTRNFFEEELSWDVFANKLKGILDLYKHNHQKA